MLKYLIGAVLLVLALYGAVKAWPLIAGPSLSVTSPADYASFPDGVVMVEGVATRAATLTLDGAPLLHQENGSFSSTLTFPRGGSILTLVATDRFGRSVTVIRNIFVPADVSVGPPTRASGLTNN